MIFVFLGFMPIMAYLGGANAIMYYVAIRRPDRIALDDFREQLPELLQFFYFNPSNAYPYITLSDRSAIDYLLTMKTRPKWILFTWLCHLVLFIGIVGRKAALDAANYGSVNHGDIILLCLVIAIHARIAFFGSKIRAGSSVVFSE